MQLEQGRLFIEMLHEAGTTFNCESRDDIVTAILEQLVGSNVNLGELIEGIAIHGLSIPDVICVYGCLYAVVESEKVLRKRITDGEVVRL
jgi:hypothetical protein